MDHKKLLLALGLCLCLTGCGREEPPAEQTPSLPENLPPQGGILTDVGQAETLQDYYDRTAVIGRNEWVEGDFTATRTWAEEYAVLEYPEQQAQVAFAGGFTAPTGLFRDGLSGGAILWDVALTAADGAQSLQQVQVLYFTDNRDGAHHQCLSGLLTGEDILTGRPEAYAYLMLDTRFASRMQPLPQVTAPENAQVIELDWLEGAVFENAWLLDEQFLTVDSRYSELDKTVMQVYDLNTLEQVALWEKPGYWYQASEAPGLLDLRHSDANEDGTVSVLHVTVKDGSPDIREITLREDEWQVGDTTVTWKEGSLWADDQVLLQGDPGTEDVTTTVRYMVQSVLDDHRFLYACVGWEWTEYWGVYDLDTHTRYKVWEGPDYYLDKPEDGETRTLAFTWMAGLQWGYHILDLNTLELTPLPVGHATEEDALEGFVEVNEDLTRIALVKNDFISDYQITVRDMQNGSELFSWIIPHNAVSGQPDVQLMGEDTLLVTVKQWATDTSWVYRIRY